jgi:hypothetical protein
VGQRQPHFLLHILVGAPGKFAVRRCVRLPPGRRVLAEQVPTYFQRAQGIEVEGSRG